MQIDFFLKKRKKLAVWRGRGRERAFQKKHVDIIDCRLANLSRFTRNKMKKLKLEKWSKCFATVIY